MSAVAERLREANLRSLPDHEIAIWARHWEQSRSAQGDDPALVARDTETRAMVNAEAARRFADIQDAAPLRLGLVRA